MYVLFPPAPWILFILDWGKLQNEPKVYSFIFC